MSVCLIREQRCFFEEDAWNTAPWEHDPGSKTMLDQVYNIFAHVPGLLEDMKKALADRISATAAEQDMAENFFTLGLRIKVLMEDLFHRRMRW